MALNVVLSSHLHCKFPQGIFHSLQKGFGSHQKIFGNLREIFGSHWKFFGNPGNVDSKITRIRLRKSWQVCVQYIINECSQQCTFSTYPKWLQHKNLGKQIQRTKEHKIPLEQTQLLEANVKQRIFFHIIINFWTT